MTGTEATSMTDHTAVFCVVCQAKPGQACRSWGSRVPLAIGHAHRWIAARQKEREDHERNVRAAATGATRH
jgi:hypothetical protein